MRSRSRLGTIAAALAALLGGTAAHGATAPVLTFALTSSGVLEVVLPSGVHVRSTTAGAVLPPGAYQAVLDDDVPYAEDTYHVFHVAGPGVDLTFDLVCFRTLTDYVTLQPNATYVFRDDRQPGLGSVTFATSSSAVPPAAGGSSGGPQPKPPTGGAGGISNTSLVGSDVTAYRGALSANVGASGRVTLVRGGRSVTARSLAAGRYTIAVHDSSRTRGFALQRGGLRPVVLTSAAFVGTRSRIVELEAGRWTFAAPGGAKTAFVVSPAP
ncbi:MAG TPA: hypothetical protein VFB42_04210 [Gaiellaceae bacterium]|nr:hypothetical protein [Gaiellaceae bacterium]